jgi:hypothetical protein
LAQGLVIIVPAQSQSSGAKAFGIIGGSELTVVDDHHLVQDQVRDTLRLGLKERVNADPKSVFGAISFRDRVGKLSCQQRCGIKYEFARIAHARSVFQYAEEFVPTDSRAILSVYLEALGGDVGRQRFPGILRS